MILRRPTTNGACTTSIPARQRPQTTTSSAKDASSFYTSSAVTPSDPSPNHRHSTCTLQQLNDTLLSSGEGTNDMKVSNITGLTENEEADEEEETASGTLDDETSDDGVLSDEHRPSNCGGRNALNGSDELNLPALSNALTREHRCESATCVLVKDEFGVAACNRSRFVTFRMKCFNSINANTPSHGAVG